MQKEMRKTKDEIQRALKDTHTTLYDAKDHPRNKKHFTLKPSMAASINLNPYVKEYIEVDIYGRYQPCIIRFLGIRDVFNVYLSTSEAFPDETATAHHGQRLIAFSTTGANANDKDAKFTRSSLYLCLESSSAVNVKATVAFGHDQNQKLQEQEALHVSDDVLVDKIKDEFDRKINKNKNAAELLQTASRNAHEHNTRVRIQIERMITNKNDAQSFMAEIYSKKRERL